MVLELNLNNNCISGNSTPRLIKLKGMVGGSIDTPKPKKCVKCGVKTIYGIGYAEGWVCLSCDKEQRERGM